MFWKSGFKERDQDINKFFIQFTNISTFSIPYNIAFGIKLCHGNLYSQWSGWIFNKKLWKIWPGKWALIYSVDILGIPYSGDFFHCSSLDSWPSNSSKACQQGSSSGWKILVHGKLNISATFIIGILQTHKNTGEYIIIWYFFRYSEAALSIMECQVALFWRKWKRNLHGKIFWRTSGRANLFLICYLARYVLQIEASECEVHKPLMGNIWDHWWPRLWPPFMQWL